MSSDGLTLYEFDARYRKEYGVICGVDEAGRGPLAGPVACAAVILGSEEIEGVNDSKKITEKKREILYEEIMKKAEAVSVELVWPETIDRINILEATMLGMKRAVEKLPFAPDIVLIDGNRLPDIDVSEEYVIHGDARSASIAAASIIAKVTRDRIMREYAMEFPEYGFEKHKGYGTKAHYEALREFGITPIHRLSFLKNFK